MKYIMCLGFFSQIYKINPTVRIFIDNNFLYEFNINQTHDNIQPLLNNPAPYLSNEFNKLQSVRLDPNFDEGYSPLIKLKNQIIDKKIQLLFFELDDIFKEKENINLKIQITNSFSNYTNGFLNKSTLINLAIGYLLPIDIFLNSYSFVKKTYLERVYKIDYKTIPFCYKKKKTIFNFVNPKWDFPKSKNYISWINENHHEIFSAYNYPHGGNGYYNIPLEKKQHCPKSDYYLDFEINAVTLLGLYYKYKEYEDQRNIN